MLPLRASLRPTSPGQGTEIMHIMTQGAWQCQIGFWYALPFSILLSQPLCQQVWPSHSFCLSLGIHSHCRFNVPLEVHISVSHLCCCTLFLFTLFSYIQEKSDRKADLARDHTASLHSLMPRQTLQLHAYNDSTKKK